VRRKQGKYEVIILAGGSKNLAKPRKPKTERRGFFHWLVWLLMKLVLFLTKPLWKPELENAAKIDLQLLPPETMNWEIRVGGQLVVERIAEACRQSKYIGKEGRIILVADPTKEFVGMDAVVPAGRTIGESLRNGSNELQTDGHAVVICGDAPRITGPALDQFIEQCQLSNANLYIGYVPKELSLQQYPDLPHTWAKFWNGKSYDYYCSASLVVVDPMDIDDIASQVDTAYELRKDDLGLARWIGLIDLVIYRVGRYTIKLLQRRISQIFRLRCMGIRVKDASLAFNIDDKETFELAQKYAASA
jgi:hypothetical protein